MINNAGFGRAIPIEKLTEADFDSFMNVHFKGVVFLTQKGLAMMNDGDGIVLLLLLQTAITFPHMPSTAACKGPVEMFSRYVAKENGPRGIRANTVAPGGYSDRF